MYCSTSNLLTYCVSLVICSFQGHVQQGLVLELGETVQILEKCEGMIYWKYFFWGLLTAPSTYFAFSIYSDSNNNLWS